LRKKDLALIEVEAVSDNKPAVSVSLIMKKLTIGLIGNPNSGKTTLFNQLTGARQRVGNWAG
jgi:GTPase involved in cell partitioning and DNA repair